MRKKFLALVFLTVGGLFAQLSVGIRIGPPPRPRVVAVRPPVPGPGYYWVDGYWFADGGHYRWHDGYWTRPPYEGARWIAPHHDGARFYAGYWDGNRGRFQHDHRWDRDHDRDFHHDDHDHDRDHDRR